MPLIHLIYISTLVGDDAKDLGVILQTSQRNNKTLDISGMLLFSGRNVIQVLEGEERAVCKMFRSIEMDSRHQNIFVLSRMEIAERQFGSWAMGFSQLSEANLEKYAFAAQVFKADKDEVFHRVEPGAALSLLALFAEGIGEIA
jgi:hypothetical protein